jgi:hypothetical protein
MSITEDGISVLCAAARAGGLLLTLGNAHADKVLQCYVNGVLAAWQKVPESAWTCELAGVSGLDDVFVLAVDAADGAVSFWSQVSAARPVRRLRVRLARTIVPYLPGDRWRIYRGQAGSAAATTLAAQIPIRDGASSGVGFGYHFGQGGFGWDGRAAAGFGVNFGTGEFGFDAADALWQSEPLPPGTYPLKVTILDAVGNESPAATAAVALAAPPRPASNLKVTQYVSATDTLTFTFTPSEDIE